ncbi:MAG: hypothetical protein J6O17_02230 [Eubacterium sp.]|nr:hypothetical protein [Eubacterium sp.]
MKNKTNVFLIIVLILLFVISGCTENISEEENTASNINNINEDDVIKHIYSCIAEKEINIDNILDYYIDQNDCYIANGSNIYKYDLSNNEMTMIYSFSASQKLVKIFKFNDVVVLADNYLILIDKFGNELKKIKTDLSDINSVNELLCDKSGNIYLICDDEIIIYNNNLEVIDCITGDGTYIDGAVSSMGRIIIYEEENYDVDKSSPVVYALDESFNKEYIDNIIPCACENTNVLLDGGDDDFYYLSYDGILYSYSIEDKKKNIIIKESDSMLRDEDITSFASKNNKEFVRIIDNDEETKLKVYGKTESLNFEGKKVIKILTNNRYGKLLDDVIDFNENDGDYYIEIVEVNQNIDEQLDLLIAKGEVPDIIDVSSISYEKYSSKGLFEDLIPYINEDEELSLSDFHKTYLDSMVKNGKLFIASDGFSINTVIANEKMVGEIEGWDTEGFIDFVSCLPQDCKVFCLDSKMDYFNTLISRNTDKFVDYDSLECSFDSAEFKSILRFCCEYGRDYSDMSDDEITSSIFNEYHEIRCGNQALHDEIIEPYGYASSISAFDEYTFVGYPNESKNGHYMRLNTQFCISSFSEEKEGAWRFIRRYLSSDYQESLLIEEEAFPTRIDVFEKMMLRMRDESTYYDEYGDIVPQYYLKVDENWNRLENEKLSEEDMHKLENLIDNVHGVEHYDYALLGIIQEESERYFNGDISLNDAVDIIQNRAFVYINE